MPKTLYICYFGLRQPLVQTQVIPYLLEIAKDGIEIALLTFEPDFKDEWRPEQIVEERRLLAEKGIEWHCLPYHKRFSAIATAYDILNGARFIRGMIGREKIDILHCRVHVPMLMGAIARKLSRRKPKLLFDIRGFFPEEYTDAGIWPENGLLYRSVKRIEKWLMKEADGFVVLTEKARTILFEKSATQRTTGHISTTEQGSFDNYGRPIEVIPCCVDFQNRFFGGQDQRRDEMRRNLGVTDRFVITHLGALGGLYLTEHIADFLQTARLSNSKAFALFLTQSDPKLIIPLLKERGFENSDYLVRKVASKDVPEYLIASDVGLSFVKAGYATQSRSPTKIPEYLACGLPIIANPGVGDVDELIEKNGIGVLTEKFDQGSYIKALSAVEALGQVGEKCRETARHYFDLEKIGGFRYRSIYSKLKKDDSQ